MSTAHASSITPMPAPQPGITPMADGITEAALLGHLLLGTVTTEFARFAHLDEDHFYDPRHKRVWAIMKALHQEGHTIDLTMVVSRFKADGREAGEAFLLSILAQAGDNPVDYMKALQIIEWRRDGLLQAQRLVTLFANAKIGTPAVISQLSRIALDLSIKASLLVGPLSQPETSESAAYLAGYDTQDMNAVGISTGYIDLDRAMNGYEKGRVYLIGADSGVGKSIYGQNTARSLNKRGQRGAVVSFELPVKEYIERAIASESEIDLNIIKQHRMDAAQIERFKEVLGRMGTSSAALHYVFMDKPTLADLKAKILELYYASGLDFAVIDYVDARWLTPTEKAHIGNDVAFTGAISAMFNSLAKELNIYFILLVQTNRASQNRGGKPQLTDFAGAAALERDAGFAAILQDGDPALATHGTPEIYMHILKSRTGGKGHVIKFEAQKSIFTISTWTQE